MPVVINDFEVISEAPASPGSAGAPAAPGPGELSPRDVIAIVKRSIERAARVRAH